MIVIAMGVSGSGKTTMGAGIAAALGWSFEDGDALHSLANISKMAEGNPLTDEDRASWLVTVRQFMTDWVADGIDGVVACSALRRAYRDKLRAGPGDVRFVFLDVGSEVLAERMSHRVGHFMPATLLASQLATLEKPDASEPDVVTIPVTLEMSPSVVMAEALSAVRSFLPPAAGGGATPDVGTV